MSRDLYAYEDYGQKPCYRCGSKGKVRRIKHPILGDVYNICCSNPECGTSTSRNYAWRSSSVEAWNRKPNLGDYIYDNFLEKIVKKLEES